MSETPGAIPCAISSYQIRSVTGVFNGRSLGSRNPELLGLVTGAQNADYSEKWWQKHRGELLKVANPERRTKKSSGPPPQVWLGVPVWGLDSDRGKTGAGLEVYIISSPG